MMLTTLEKRSDAGCRERFRALRLACMGAEHEYFMCSEGASPSIPSPHNRDAIGMAEKMNANMARPLGDGRMSTGAVFKRKVIMSGQVRMLLVDDDQSLVCSLAAVVSKHLAEKVCLTEMTDSVAAKDWIEERSPDLVLTDLQMPMVDGFGILEIAKKRNPSCQVIIHSGHFSEETLSLALRLGATDYLVKSDGVDNLLHALEQAHSRIVRWKRVSAAPSTLL